MKRCCSTHAPNASPGAPSARPCADPNCGTGQRPQSQSPLLADVQDSANGLHERRWLRLREMQPWGIFATQAGYGRGDDGTPRGEIFIELEGRYRCCVLVQMVGDDARRAVPEDSRQFRLGQRTHVMEIGALRQTAARCAVPGACRANTDELEIRATFGDCGQQVKIYLVAVKRADERNPWLRNPGQNRMFRPGSSAWRNSAVSATLGIR